MSYAEKEALKQLPEASSRPKFSGTGEDDHMELINYIDGLLIDVASIPDYWITSRRNTEFEGHASIWYTLWQKTISFENQKYFVDKGPFEWCLRQSKRLKAIDPQMNTQMRNHKLLTPRPGEGEHALNSDATTIAL
ncbi:hypothetical protein O181_082260 [Austropuccinia psidii MF-1]|uniref:Uncharacterized protein n=1 Tax=Austropuccinia psidii MF-1 TaxID=1389203 RepID=A0A9Q3IKP1_9BASI|nr:hypothetical protein [Austropuccinia psidii MF-1]